jgi:hypothetical protein
MSLPWLFTWLQQFIVLAGQQLPNMEAATIQAAAIAKAAAIAHIG